MGAAFAGVVLSHDAEKATEIVETWKANRERRQQNNNNRGGRGGRGGRSGRGTARARRVHDDDDEPAAEETKDEIVPPTVVGSGKQATSTEKHAPASVPVATQNYFDELASDSDDGGGFRALLCRRRA